MEIDSKSNIIKSLPNSTSVLVLGILSIVCCSCYGVVGLILGIIALSQAKKDTVLYYRSPELYTSSSYSNIKAGKTCAIIGLCLSGLVLLYMAVIIMIYGTILSSLPWDEIINK